MHWNKPGNSTYHSDATSRSAKTKSRGRSRACQAGTAQPRQRTSGTPRSPQTPSLHRGRSRWPQWPASSSDVSTARMHNAQLPAAAPSQSAIKLLLVQSPSDNRSRWQEYGESAWTEPAGFALFAPVDRISTAVFVHVNPASVLNSSKEGYLHNGYTIGQHECSGLALWYSGPLQ